MFFLGTNRGEGTFLLKQVKPVAPTSGRAAGRLTEKNVPRKARLADRAADVEEYVRNAGGSMPTSQLEAHIRQGGLDGLRGVLRKNSITIRGFLRLYRETFQTRAGVVTVRTATPAPAPEPPTPETPSALTGSSTDPLPGGPDPRSVFAAGRAAQEQAAAYWREEQRRLQLAQAQNAAGEGTEEAGAECGGGAHVGGREKVGEKQDKPRRGIGRQR